MNHKIKHLALVSWLPIAAAWGATPPPPQAPTWGVPVGERKVVFQNAVKDVAPRLVVENGFLRASIRTGQGWRIER
ncbi:MAG: hypothetical protein HY360_24495 [Verrucomicrobia bacterium]|nr:hypothetical protein [Verrucomicrobiota bacterium]